MEKEQLLNKIENTLKEEIIDFKLCSRLTWKNEVFLCKTNKNKYAIKLYKDNNNSNIRSLVEYEMYKFIRKLDINTPKIVYNGKIKENNLLITEWIDGISLKNFINQNGVEKSKDKVIELLNNYEKIWSLKVPPQIGELLNKNRIKDSKSMLYTRTNSSKVMIFSELKVEDTIINIYNNLENNIKINSVMINSDISLHEVIYNNNKNYWIDLESFTMGDANNDLAGIFYSLSNSLVNDNKQINILTSIIKKNAFFNVNKFVFYLIERVLSANYLDKIDKNEIDFYTKLIIKLLK